MFVYLDIETLPAAWTDAEIDAAARAAVPGNYSKPDSIEKWIVENRGEVLRRTALDSMAARILAIGVAIEDDPVGVLYNEHGTDEGLCAMFDRLAHVLLQTPGQSLVGHNIAGFDLPMLLRSAWRLDHPLADCLPKRRSDRVVDTAELWRATDPNPARVKLSAMASFLGLGEKAEGMDGSKVYDAWLAGQHKEIRRYCAQDVELVRAIHGRIW